MRGCEHPLFGMGGARVANTHKAIARALNSLSWRRQLERCPGSHRKTPSTLFLLDFLFCLTSMGHGRGVSFLLLSLPSLKYGVGEMLREVHGKVCYEKAMRGPHKHSAAE